jgi:hypothetical protein
MKKLKILWESHVYVVLEMPGAMASWEEPRIHGVFANREHATEKALKLKTRHHAAGYVAVLKQRVLG